MIGDFDIQLAAQEILSEGRIVEVDGLAPEDGPLDAGDSSLLVGGDVSEGAVIKEEQSALIEGSLVGNFDRPCRVEVGGDVVVMGSAQHAHVSARDIRIGSDVSGCTLKAQSGIEVGASLSQSQLVAGDSEADRRKIFELRQMLLRSDNEIQFIERQLKIEEKRMDRQFQSTRFKTPPTLGGIMKSCTHRIQIDLKPLYQAMGQRTEGEIDAALKEFFAKAVVGQLVRVNIKSGQHNRLKGKILTSIITSLNDLFMLTRKRDKKLSDTAHLEAELRQHIQVVNNRTGVIHVRGRAAPGVNISIIQTEANLADDREISLDVAAAKLSIRPGAEDGRLQVERTDTREDTTTLDVGRGELENVTFRVHKRQIIWEATSSQ